MKIKKLIKELPIEVFSGSREQEIMGLCTHSKRVCPGDLFIVRKGATHHGADYIYEAVQTGAVAVLSEFGDPFLQGVTQLINPNINALVPTLASRFYEHPSRELFTVGITGTNGKTTVSYLVKHLLDHLGLKSGLIGTVEYIIGENYVPAERTTPDIVDLHKLLAKMRSVSSQAAIMEVSSHGLAQKRTDLVDFDAAIFTNLSQDHLDYHETMEAYFHEKTKLFTNLLPGQWSIVNITCPYGRRLVQKIHGPLLTYGFDKNADLCADTIKCNPQGSSFIAAYKEQRVPFSIPLIGSFNILNALAALGVLLTRGMSLHELSSLLENFEGVPGRLEQVKNNLGLHVFVDYAHTPDALEKVLETLKELPHRRLIVVFGCGGDRDQDKRPKMGAISGTFADLTIITSDNPRNEDPEKICREIAEGITKSSFLVIPDRRQAIRCALEKTRSNDLILITGKGHETYQVFSHQTIAFDDRKVAQNLMNERETSCAKVT